MSQPPLSCALRALAVAALAALSLPAWAVGAKCADGGPAADITPQYQNGVLRCIRRAQATPACPPTHPMYKIMPEQAGQPPTDFCAPANIIVPAPSQRASVMCPPGMNLVVNGGSGKRDECRATSTTQVVPILIPN